MNNAEITALKKILGLQTGKSYDNADSLRYGQVMIMADQDHDGSHIKGLFINFIHSFWPSGHSFQRTALIFCSQLCILTRSSSSRPR